MGLEDGEEEDDFEEEKKDAPARLGSKARRKRLRKLKRQPSKYVPPPCEVEVSNLPFTKRNGPKFCSNIGLKYVRFLIAFPMEALNRNLIIWKIADLYQGRDLLPFDRAVGTAMVYAHLDMKNIVGHVPWLENLRRRAASLDDAHRRQFSLACVQFKAMLSAILCRRDG